MSDARRIIDLVYGDPVQKPATEEVAAARRVLSVPGVTVESVRLMMLIVGSSPRFWGPMFETACSRGYGMRRLEDQLKGIQLALSRDPSAPGNRAADAAYGEYEDPRGPEVEEHVEQTLAQKTAAVQQPWKDLIAEGMALGLRERRLFDWVMDQRAKRTGKPRSDYPTSRSFTREIAGAMSAPKTHWTEREEPRQSRQETFAEGDAE